MERNIFAETGLYVTLLMLHLVDVSLNLIKSSAFSYYVPSSLHNYKDSGYAYQRATEENPELIPGVQPLLVKDDGSAKHIEKYN